MSFPFSLKAAYNPSNEGIDWSENNAIETTITDRLKLFD
jgi:hypothetical protein